MIKIERYPRYAVIVVAEGATAIDEGLVTIDTARDAFGHERLGGIGNLLAERIRRETPFDARAVVIGHSQRGRDSVCGGSDYGQGCLASAAVEAVAQGDFGKMVSAHGVAPACHLSLVPAGKGRRHSEDGRY